MFPPPPTHIFANETQPLSLSIGRLLFVASHRTFLRSDPPHVQRHLRRLQSGEDSAQDVVAQTSLSVSLLQDESHRIVIDPQEHGRPPAPASIPQRLLCRPHHVKAVFAECCCRRHLPPHVRSWYRPHLDCVLLSVSAPNAHLTCGYHLVSILVRAAKGTLSLHCARSAQNTLKAKKRPKASNQQLPRIDTMLDDKPHGTALRSYTCPVHAQSSSLCIET